MPIVSHIVSNDSDITIMLALAALIGLFAVALFWLSSFVLKLVNTAEHEGYALETEKYGLTLAIFILALTVADVRGSIGKAGDAAIAEAQQIMNLDSSFALLPRQIGEPLRQTTQEYVEKTITHEWPLLGKSTPKLSPEVTAVKDRLWTQVARAAADPAHANVLSLAQRALQELDLKRVNRYELATSSIPNIYWVAMLGSLGIAVVLTGRSGFNIKKGGLVFIRYFIFGLIVALVVAMDQPYRGETHVNPVALQEALMTLKARSAS